MKTSSSHRLGMQRKQHTNTDEFHNENYHFIDCSILIALGMVYEGLDGSTRANVASSLGFPEDEQRFRDGFKVYRDTIFSSLDTHTKCNVFQFVGHRPDPRIQLLSHLRQSRYRR